MSTVSYDDFAKLDLRVAKIREEIARQTVRRQRMAAIALAEGAYVNAYMAQEAVVLRQRSLEISESFLKDVEERKKQGKGCAKYTLACPQARQITRWLRAPS